MSLNGAHGRAEFELAHKKFFAHSVQLSMLCEFEAGTWQCCFYSNGAHRQTASIQTECMRKPQRELKRGTWQSRMNSNGVHGKAG